MITATELLYDKDAYIKDFDAKVLSTEIKKWNKKDVLSVVLDRTCFFPEQGGQNSDTGFLNIVLPDRNIDLKVIYVSIKDDVIEHYCELDSELSECVNCSCHGEINWEARYDKMQQHSGEHIVSGIVNSMFGYNNVGFHLGDEEVTMDYDGIFTDEQLIELEKRVNEAVLKDIRCLVSYPTSEELKTIDYRSKKELTGQVRIVEFEGYDICACCAPHIKTTGEIGMVKILSSEHFKGGTRMTIKCGMRALNSFNEHLNSCREISRLLSVKIENVLAGTKKIYEDLQKKNYALIELQNKMVNVLVEDKLKDDNTKYHLIFVEDFDINVMRNAVNTMTDKVTGICGCFNGNDEIGYSFILGSNDTDCNIAMNVLKTQYGAKGGGKPSMVQGNVVAGSENICNVFEAI